MTGVSDRSTDDPRRFPARENKILIWRWQISIRVSCQKQSLTLSDRNRHFISPVQLYINYVVRNAGVRERFCTDLRVKDEVSKYVV